TNTSITSATDGNNNPIQNDGSTTSTSITFNVQATAGTNPLAGFQCGLDNGPFSSCNVPITYNSLAPGQHTFKVQAVDSQGNVDPNPATFTWTVTQQQQSPPISNAGSNQRVQSFQTVTLDGSKSHDKNGFTPLTYQWTQTSGPAVSLNNNMSPNPTFNAPSTTTNIKLTFQLIVTNSEGVQSQPSSVTITVTR
ncbi:MAG TPA: hypothetical protein VIY08_07210, partial [Candidatus Nitrosocosmicus sp.]